MTHGAVLVTGATSGIGQAVAVAVARAGTPVAVGTFDGDTNDPTETVRAVERVGGRALVVDADVRDAQELADACDQAVSAFGPLAGVVANAGWMYRARLSELTDDIWHGVLDIDLTGVMRTVRAATARMGDGGAVVCVSSISGGAVGATGHTPYGAAKAGVLGFVRSASLELADRQIRINAVLPGVIESAQSLDPVHSGGPDGLVISAARIPLGRVGPACRRRRRGVLPARAQRPVRDRADADGRRRSYCRLAKLTSVVAHRRREDPEQAKVDVGGCTLAVQVTGSGGACNQRQRAVPGHYKVPAGGIR